MKRIVAAVLLAFCGSVNGGLAQVPAAFDSILSGNLEGEEVDLFPVHVGAADLLDLLVLIHAPEQGDLDLEVRASSDAGSAECASSGVGATERCRWRVPPGTDSAWVRVSLYNGSGVTGYSVYARRISGPMLGASGLYAGEVQPLPAEGTLRDSLTADEMESVLFGDVALRAYRLPDLAAVPPSDLPSLSLFSYDSLLTFDVLFFDDGGEEIRAARQHGLRPDAPPVGIPSNAWFLVLDTDPVDSDRLFDFEHQGALAWDLAYRPAGAPIPIRLTDAGFVTRGSLSRRFEFEIPQGSVASAVAFGEGVRLVAVTDNMEFVDYSLPSLEGRARVLHLGRPRSDVAGLSGPFESDRLIVLSLEVPDGIRDPRVYAQPEWRLDIRLNERASPPFLLRLEESPLDVSPVEFGRTSLTASVEEQRAVWGLPATPLIDRLPRLEARVPPNRARILNDYASFDLLVASEFGEVHDIGNTDVAWYGARDGRPLFLVVFQRMPTAAVDAPALVSILVEIENPRL